MQAHERAPARAGASKRRPPRERLRDPAPVPEPPPRRRRRTVDPEPLSAEDTLRGILMHTDERFQALSIGLGRLEAAVRGMAAGDRGAEAAQMTEELQRLRWGILRLAREQRAIAARLEAAHRAALDDVARRMGRGVVAVARRLEEDLLRAMAETAGRPEER